MPALAIPATRFWRTALISLLLLYEVEKWDAATKKDVDIFNSPQR